LHIFDVQLQKRDISSSAANTEFLEKFDDGKYAKQHPLFGTGEISLQLLMYYDDFEVVNQIGSKTGKHQMGILHVVLIYV